MRTKIKNSEKVVTLKIDLNRSARKYEQIINSVIGNIEDSILKPGDRLPSINEVSEEYYLSRDTVERAYVELRERGIVSSIPGKGYFVKQLPQGCDNIR